MVNDLRLPAALVALGLVIGGWFIGQGFSEGRADSRFVTVKGISERDVKADTALWPIRFVATNDVLAQAQSNIKRSHEKVLAFLNDHGIAESATEVQQLEVTDRLANPYGNQGGPSRYIIAETIMVRTEDPDLVAAASQAVGELVDAGVVLSSQGGPQSGPTYLFTKLSDLKPEMIAEATANARRSAEQFAQDSGAELGSIRRANQGLFVILPRDRAMGIMEQGQLNKTVRVVSTLDFYLE